VFVPDGQYKITKTWLLDDYASIEFESRNAILRTAANIDMMAGRGTSGYHHTPYRNFRIQIHSGQLNGPAADNGQAAMNWESCLFVKVFGTEFFGIQYGIKNGGPSSVGGRCNDMLIGTEYYDNTDNSYWGFATEGYSNCGARVSHTGQASQRIRFMGGRYENLAGGATAGIVVNAAAQNTVTNAPIFINAGAVNISDSGTSTVVTAPYV
jgi:hypothetical protein